MTESSPLSILHPQKAKRSLTFNQKFVIVISALIAAPVLLVVVFLVATADVERSISGPVTVSTQWVEFSPKKPLLPSKAAQVILLEVDPAEALVVDNSHLERIQLGNGVLVKPEIQLVDSQGNVFVADVYRSPVPSYLDNSIVGNVRGLPQDRMYTKVRVRSDDPVRLTRVLWYCFNEK